MIQMDSVRVPQDQVKRGALLLAALLGVLAAWFLWSGVQQWRGHARETQLGSARDQVAQTVGAVLSDRTATLARQLDRAEVKAALAAGDAGAAAEALREGWSGAEGSLVLTTDLTAAYADAPEFGFARLGLLEKATDQGQPVAMLVREEGATRLGVAAPARLGSLPAVAYVRLPLAELTTAVEQAPLPSGTYLALRQGGFNLIERGDAGLSNSADMLSRDVGKTGLRVAAAVPDVGRGPFGLGAIACLVVAAVLAALAALAVLLARGKLPQLRRKAATGALEDAEPTLGQTLKSGQDEARAVPAAPVRTAAAAAAIAL